MGKLAELDFTNFLINRGVKFSTSGMLQIYEGAINVEQFNSEEHKDYYVTVKLNASDKDSRLKLVDMNSVTNAQIL